MTTSRLAQVFWRLTGRWQHQRFGRRGGRLSTGIRLSGGQWREPQPVQGPRLMVEVQAPVWVTVDEALALKARPLPQVAALGAAIASVLDEMAQVLGKVKP